MSVVGSTATVTFGAADAAALQALVDSLAYRNTSQNPTDADRVITITSLTDFGRNGRRRRRHRGAEHRLHRQRQSGQRRGHHHRRHGRQRDGGRRRRQWHADRDRQPRCDRRRQHRRRLAGGCAGAASQNGFGTYALNADGTWTYTLDNDNPAVQALNGAATLTDSFVALTEDGTAQMVTVTIHAQNDAAAITGDAAGTVTEAGLAGAGSATDSGDLDATDVDNPNDAWQAVAAGTASANGYGTYELTAAGVWTYTLDNTNAAVQALNGARHADRYVHGADRGRHRAGRHDHDQRRERRRDHHRRHDRRRHRGRRRRWRHADRDRQSRLDRRRQSGRRLDRGGGRNGEPSAASAPIR